MTDRTDSLISDANYHRPQHLRAVKPAKSLTPTRLAVLRKLHGMRIDSVSNAVLYARQLRALKPVEHKAALALLLAGHLRVYRKPGPVTGERSPFSGVAEECHYEIRVVGKAAEAIGVA